MIEHIEHLGGDYGVTVIFTFDPEHPHHVKFFAAEIAGRGVPDDAPLYTKKGATVSSDHVEDPRLAERFVAGSVKWDGCAHLNFGSDDGYVHFCGREDFDKVGSVMPMIYERCGAIMKEHEVYLLDGAFWSSLILVK